MKFDEKLFKTIEESKAKNKLLIVPAQLTLSAEQAAFDITKKDGFFDLQIMSGNKLRSEIIAKTGGSGRSPINTLGRSMILRKCAKEAGLNMYKDLASSADFLSAAGDFIVQAKQTLNDEIEIKESYPKILQEKLSDMIKLKSLYDSYMEGKYIDSEDGLLFATSQITKCKWIKESEIWFTGFYSFTKREEAFLKALDENSLGCHVILTSPKEVFPKTLMPVIEADSKYDEAIKTAGEILRLIREEKYTAEDIMILSADVSKDGPNFKRIFEALGIPVYIDEKKSVMHLEAASKIVNLLDMAADGIQTHSAIEFVDDPDFTNYVNSYHIKGDAFLSYFKYGGEEKIEAEIKRDEFANIVSPFLDAFSKAETVKEKSETLYLFLFDTLNMPEELRAKAAEYEEAGYIEASEELAQGWDVIVSILDQAVELLGSEKLSNEEYRDLIKNAFKDVKIGLLPQNPGCIAIGDLYRSKAYGVKALFVSSFNDGNIPRNLSSKGILTDDEQAKLESPLCKSYSQLAKEDRCIIFDAFDSPSEKLYFSYSTSDFDGKAISPSYMLMNLPRASEYEEVYSLEELLKRLREYKSDGKELDSAWKAAANRMSGTDRYKAAVMGLLFKNPKESLSKKTSEEILRPSYISPSALERYALCPYSYFVRYGLKAKEPVDFTIQPKDIGDIYHEVLNRLSRQLSSDGKSARDSASLWQSISDEEIENFVAKTVDDIKKEDSSGLLSKGNAEEYSVNKVKRLALKFALNMVHQLRLGNVDIVESEKSFEFNFKDVKIHGKIDRLDTTRLSDKELVKVIDYKSGSAQFNPDSIRKGLALQLMLYLESATEKGAKPVGSFYFHIKSEAAESDIFGELSKKAAEKIASSYMLDGAFVTEPEAFATLDKTVNAGEKSNVVNKNKGLSEAEYEDLRNAFRDSLSKTLSELEQGSVAAQPKKTGTDSSSCTYCPYKSICKFDPQVEGYITLC